MAARAPLRLFWWNRIANFGDGISPVVVAHVSGRAVVWAAPDEAEVFAVGSILRTVARSYRGGAPDGRRPVIWGSGCLKPVGRGFMAHVDFAAVRGPRTAEVLRLGPLPMGDPGLLIRAAMGEDIAPGEEIALVAHHAHRSDPALRALAGTVPGLRWVDVTDPDPLAVVRAIASCRHVVSSSLHGLVIADAFGRPSTWLDPTGIHAEATFKFHDYAAAIGRDLGAPVTAAALPAHLAGLADTSTVAHGAAIAAAQSALNTSFPAALRA